MSNGLPQWGLTGLLALSLLFPALSVNASGWKDGAPMPTGRAFAGAALLQNELYVIGGDSASGPRNVVEIYDARGDVWRASPGLPVGLQQAGVTSYAGRLYVAGGYQAELASRPDMAVLSGAASTQTPDGDTARIWVYDPNVGTWINGATMPGVRAGHGLLAIRDRIYVVGGRGDDASRIWVYDPEASSWQATGSPMPSPRVAAAYVAVNDLIYVIGGMVNGNATARVDIFDTRSSQWRSGSSLPEARSGHVAVLLDGNIHVTGGEQHRPPRTFGDHFVLDLSSGAWRKSVSLPTPRHGAVAAVMGDKFIIAGGSPGAGVYTVFTESDAVDIYEAD